jgi:hypothetical protein
MLGANKPDYIEQRNKIEKLLEKMGHACRARLPTLRKIPLPLVLRSHPQQQVPIEAMQKFRAAFYPRIRLSLRSSCNF